MNREERKVYMKKWHQNHKKEDEAYYLKNKEHILARSRDYNEKHKEKKKAYDKDYAKGYMPAYLRNRTDKMRMKIIELLGGQCANPYGLHDKPFTDFRCLQIDHVNGNGYEEKHKFNSPYSYYKYILEQAKAGSPFYQCLCANCNWIKRWENPSERRR